MPKQVWVTEDKTTFDTEEEAKLYELKEEYATKIFAACNHYFTPEQMIANAVAVRALLNDYLIERGELRK